MLLRITNPKDKRSAYKWWKLTSTFCTYALLRTCFEYTRRRDFNKFYASTLDNSSKNLATFLWVTAKMLRFLPRETRQWRKLFVLSIRILSIVNCSRNVKSALGNRKLIQNDSNGNCWANQFNGQINGDCFNGKI